MDTKRRPKFSELKHRIKHTYDAVYNKAKLEYFEDTYQTEAIPGAEYYTSIGTRTYSENGSISGADDEICTKTKQNVEFIVENMENPTMNPYSHTPKVSADPSVPNDAVSNVISLNIVKSNGVPNHPVDPGHTDFYNIATPELEQNCTILSINIS